MAYVIVWESRPHIEREAEFERVYGPEGDWAQFLIKGDGYVRTDLLHDAEIRGRYPTLDYWTSETAYNRFRSIFTGDMMRLIRSVKA